MNLATRDPFQLAISYLYDPISLDKVELDTLKDEIGGVQYSPEAEQVYAESAEKKLKAQILSARLDYIDENSGDFDTRDLSAVKKLLRALPSVNLKGFGVTLYLRAAVVGEKDAGIYLMRHFLANADGLQRKLNAAIIADAHRVTYGHSSGYFDLRLTPDQIGGEILHLHLRKHQETSLKDCDRIFDETVVARQQTASELQRLLEIL